jgi:hypothetical protein
MSLMNLNLALLAYEDGPASVQPKLRLADLQWSLLGIPTKNFKQIPLSLAPGELLNVASTARTLTFNGSTSFVITKSGDRMRITAGIGQRTARSYGDSTTEWTLSRTGNVMRLESTGGTAPNFASMNAGDFIFVGSGFSPFNQGEHQIVKRGANYVEYMSDIGAAEGPITGGINIYASGPVQKGDILDLNNTNFASPNQGTYPVLLATDTFIEVLNQDAFPETVTGITSGLTIYPFAYKWMFLVVDHKVVAGLNGETPSDKLIVEPAVEGDLTKSPGLLLKRGKVFEVQIFNPTLQQVSGFLILAE